MGIPAYMSFILKNYPHLIDSLCKKRSMDCLFMDSNSIIYDVYNRTKDSASSEGDFENHIIDEVIRKIEEYILLLNPRQILFIAFDGVAPMAKMEQQRLRRYKNWHSGTFFQQGVKDPTVWNTSSITPGTEFMDLLSRRIKAQFHKGTKKYGVEKIIVSGSDEVGEGEQKIFKYIRSNPNLENIFVYGLDSDLIMLSLFHCSFTSFFVS